MKIPTWAKPVALGAAGGAVATMVVGFSFASSDVLHPTVWILALMLQSWGTGALPEGDAPRRRGFRSPVAPRSEEAGAQVWQRTLPRITTRTR